MFFLPSNLSVSPQVVCIVKAVTERGEVVIVKEREGRVGGKRARVDSEGEGGKRARKESVSERVRKESVSERVRKESESVAETVALKALETRTEEGVGRVEVEDKATKKKVKKKKEKVEEKSEAEKVTGEVSAEVVDMEANEKPKKSKKKKKAAAESSAVAVAAAPVDPGWDFTATSITRPAWQATR